MLGLGSGIHLAQRPGLRLLYTYTSDFTSDADGWAALSVQGTLTIQANQTIDSTGGWLKCSYDTNQTDTLSGIIRDSDGYSGDRQAGDVFTVTYKIYLQNVSGEDWGGADDVWTIFKAGEVGNDGLQHAQDTTVTAAESDFSIPQTDGWGSTLQLYFSASGDKPSADAVFYVKDIIVKYYRP